MSATEPRRKRATAALLGLILLSVPAGAREGAREGARVIPLASVEARGDRTGTIEVRGPEPKPAEKKAIGFEARGLPSNATPGEMTVVVDRAKVIRLPEGAQTIIIGNPAVADIAVQKSGVVVLTGKSFGVTNFIAMDAGGNQIAEAKVSVIAPSDATVLVQRGLERQTYSCAPQCLPTVQLGDSNAYFGETKGQADAHTAFTAPR